MKTEIQIPTVQFGLIKVSFDEVLDKNIAIAVHNGLLKSYQDSLKEPEVQIGLDSKIWRACVDNLLLGVGLLEEDMYAMSEKQKSFIAELQRGITRIKNREAK